MYVSLFSYVWIPESPPNWERAAESVSHLFHLFTDVTSSCDFFPFVYCGRSLRFDCVGSCSLPSSILVYSQNVSGPSQIDTW